MSYIDFFLNARYDINIFIEGYEWLGELWFILDLLVLPIMIVVATAAGILLTVLGVKASKAETPDKREKKMRLIKRIIWGVVVAEVLLALMYVFHLFLPQIVQNLTKDLVVDDDTLVSIMLRR